MVSASGCDRVELLPREGRRHLRAGARAYRPGAEDRLVRRVLVEVDEDTPPPFLLPPGACDELGPAALELAGRLQRPRSAPRTTSSAAGGARTRGCRGCPSSSEGTSRQARRSSARTSRAASWTIENVTPGRRVEVDAQLVGVVWVGRQRRPDVEAEAGQVHGPQDVGQVGRNQRPRGGAVGSAHDGGLEPVGAGLGHPLLKERRAARHRWGSAAGAPAGRPWREAAVPRPPGNSGPGRAWSRRAR